MEQRIREAIISILTKNKEIVIYPFGFYGKLAKEILNSEFGIKELCVVDNNCSDDNIFKIEDLNTKKNE